MIRNQISSTIEDLNRLHSTYPWIPDELSIRPDAQLLAIKQQIMLHIANQWESTKDYILYNVFKQHIQIHKDTGRLNCPPQSPPPDDWILHPCMFRYNLPKQVNHDVLWNYSNPFLYDFDQSIINDLITVILYKKLSHQNFDFAWYKNPKPSVLDFYHVQVFWITLSP